MKLGMDSEFNNSVSYKVPVNYPLNHNRITGAVKFPKEKDKFSYLGVIEALSKSRISPNHYKINDAEGFQTDPKLCRFANNKQPRVTIFAELEKKKGYLPSPSHYSPERKDKVVGNYRT